MSKYSIASPFNLDKVAAILEGLEETIIYRLLDRAQFAANMAAYQDRTHSISPWSNLSLFELRLRLQEEMDSRFGRFLVPEERPFLRDLPPPQRVPPRADASFPIESFELISQASRVMTTYLNLIPSLCPEGDDGHYGSSVESDVSVLQALGRRIHFGSLYVAESKFLADPELYGRLILKKDREGIRDALTRKEVEKRILVRIRGKIDHLQQKMDESVRRRVDPGLIMSYYESAIIPLTKEGEIAYLLARSKDSPHE